MNSVNITGRVGGDIELRYTPSGKAVCNVNLAVDEGFGDNKKTLWLDVTIWDKQAETAQKFVHKGDMLAITGRLSQDEWEDKQTGKKMTKIKLVSESMTLLPNGKREEGWAAPAMNHKATETQRKAAPRAEAPKGYDNEAGDFDEEDDIPF